MELCLGLYTFNYIFIHLYTGKIRKNDGIETRTEKLLFLLCISSLLLAFCPSSSPNIIYLGLLPKCYSTTTLTTCPPVYICTCQHCRLRSAQEAACVLLVFFWVCQTLNLNNCFENRLLESNPTISLAKILIHLQKYCHISFLPLILYPQKYVSFLSVIMNAIWFQEVKSGLDREVCQREMGI